MPNLLTRFFPFISKGMPSAHARREGLWKGLCLGDKNGGPTQMAMRLKESLEELRRFCPQDIFFRYYQWWCKEGFDTGPTVEGVFQLVLSGMERSDAVKVIYDESNRELAGCNPAHRSAPLAMMDFLQIDKIDDLARQEARLTHLHPDSAETAAAVVLLCRYLIDGLAWHEALNATAAKVVGPARLALFNTNGGALSPVGDAPEVLRAAIAFVSTQVDFRSALQTSLVFAGPANYCPVLVGCIAGARWGVSEYWG
jgi:ADP-ribosylglycohydrolase